MDEWILFLHTYLLPPHFGRCDGLDETRLDIEGKGKWDAWDLKERS